MSSMQINDVLAQIRALSSQTQALARPAAQVGATQTSATQVNATTPGGFGQMLKQGIDAVNQTQQKSAALADAYERGVEGVDLARVMIETQKASVSFRALTEVRNRLVNAYQDIMNMPI
jgi:flagellar hook-basal body complex protein FliE